MTEEIRETQDNQVEVTENRQEGEDVNIVADVENPDEPTVKDVYLEDQQVENQIPDKDSQDKQIEKEQSEVEEQQDIEYLQSESQTQESESEPQDNQNQVEEPSEQTLTLESVIEAVLFASDEPLTSARLANIVEATTKQVRDHIDSLNEKYKANNNAFMIEQIAGGFQMLTLSCYNHWLRQLLRVRSESKLSPAAMETLAIIAYKQPVIRADIEAIRGVAVGEVIRSLSFKGLVKIVGRAEILGRPMLYGTTKKFLEVFGLNSLKDLPKIEELKKPDN